MDKQIEIIQTLDRDHCLDSSQWEEILRCDNEQVVTYAAKLAQKRAKEQFGEKIYVRGLIEISNYCKNNCFYCGIRRDNHSVKRYRLKKEEILECAKQGYQLGFRTFVLQGGEDAYFTDTFLLEVVSALHERYADCAITLSLGERNEKSYRLLYEAGANRYLLRHETADKCHYEKLHPSEMSWENRMRCLKTLKEIGYQVGCGFMVGSPGQTIETLAKDMRLISELQPEMVGIGPFVPHHATPLKGAEPGSVKQTLYLLSLIRIMKPDVLLPATTALGTMDANGRERGILAGANVLMPNLSPSTYRKQYELYDNKICTGEEAAECKRCLEQRMKKIGYEIVTDRGDAPGWERM